MNNRFKIINDNLKINDDLYEKTIVIIYLYYIDTLEFYNDWIKKIPNKIRIVIISSDEAVIKKIQKLIGKRDITYVIKENRGRDISALLISAKDYLNKYTYFCYIHDKKANSEWLKEDVKEWTYCLWHNTLKDEKYINGILDFLYSMPDAGLLQPPNVVCDKLPIGYADNWYGNLDNCNQLLEMLKINRTLTEEDEVLGVGTVFWARKQCLKKLLDYFWTYDLFPEEPLPLDGTISHAIERSMPYIAEEAGFKTYTVMSKEYAEAMLGNTHEALRIMYSFIKKNDYLYNCYEMKIHAQRLKDIKNYIQTKKEVYIYGAGEYGTSLMKCLKREGIEVDGFIVTRIDRKKLKIDIPVYEIDQISFTKQTGVIIGVSYDKIDIIKKTLINRGFNDFIDGYSI